MALNATRSQLDSRQVRVDALRELFKKLKLTGIISKYEVTKSEKVSSPTEDVYRIKLAGLSGSLPEALPILINAYLPEARVTAKTADSLNLVEAPTFTLQAPEFKVKTLDAVRVLGKLIDVCMTTPTSNDGRRTNAMRLVVANYL